MNLIKKPFYFIPFLALAVLLSSHTAQAQYYLRKSNNNVLDRFLSGKMGKSLSLSQIDQTVRDISQSGLFQIVYAEKVSPREVVIRAQEIHSISEIDFQGNKAVDTDTLIKKMGLKVGQKASDLEIKIAINNVKKAYQEKGFYNFKINYSKVPNEDNISLIINIDESQFCTLEEIKVFSKNKDLNIRLRKRLLDFSRKSFGKYTSNEVEREIEAYFLENRYLTARVSEISTKFNDNKTKVKINISISNPTRFEFIFNGNKHFSHFDLIKKSKIGGTFLYLSDSSSEIIDNIKKYYLSNGFPKVKVQHRSQHYPNLNKQVLIFEIEEGDRVRIGELSISGKFSRARSFYTNKLKEKLSDQGKSIYFVEDAVEKATEALILELKREGYLQAEITGKNIQFTKDHLANIELQIDEGILTYIRQILFRGAKSFSNIELKEKIDLQTNKPLNIKLVEDSFDKLDLFYKNQGHLEFEIKNRDSSVIKYKPGQPYADIVYQVNEGPKIHVNDIVLNGNLRTKDYVILRELDFTNGDVLTRDRVSTTVERLEKTGLFAKVNVRPLEKGSKKKDRSIMIEVDERSPGLANAGVGLLSEGLLTFRGYGGILYNNLWGKARGVSGRLDLKYSTDERISYLENRIAVAYYEPYLFEDRMRGRVSLIREESFFAFNDSGTADILARNQIRLSMEKEVSKHLRFTYNLWNFANETTFNRADRNDSKTINIGASGPLFELDYRNDQFLPTSGTYSRLEFDYAGPILGSSRDQPGNPDPLTNKSKEVHFVRLSASSTLYTPLTRDRRWVWANSVRGGYLKNISTRKISGVPASRAFFLGGNSSIRGFQPRSNETVPGRKELCIKQGIIQTSGDTCELDEFFVTEESTFFLVKSEVRFPIYGNFGGLIFYDGGAVYLTEFALEDPYRDSVGLGFRYDTPVGSLVAQVGYKLDRKSSNPDVSFDKDFFEEESDLVFHLAIGTF